MNTGLSEIVIKNTSLKETKTTLPKVSDIKTPYDFIKRTCDIGLSSVGLIVLAPVFLLIGIAIKIDSKGPTFFVHKRIGKNGKIINIYKFRTMYEDSEDMIKKFSKEQIEEYKENYKLKQDPRVTKILKKDKPRRTTTNIKHTKRRTINSRTKTSSIKRIRKIWLK